MPIIEFFTEEQTTGETWYVHVNRAGVAGSPKRRKTIKATGKWHEFTSLADAQNFSDQNQKETNIDSI